MAIATLRCAGERGEFDFTIPLVWTGAYTPMLFSTEHYPRYMELELVLPPATLLAAVKELNDILLAYSPSACAQSACLPTFYCCGLGCLPLIGCFVLARARVAALINRINQRWAVEGRAARLQLSPGCTLHMAKLIVVWRDAVPAAAA